MTGLCAVVLLSGLVGCGPKELKEYFANYKKVNRLQQIDKCKEDIERYKKWILENEETLKKLEEDEELS